MLVYSVGQVNYFVKVTSYILLATELFSNSYTIAARDFADIYTQSPRAAGPRVYMSAKSQAAMVQVIYITWGALT